MAKFFRNTIFATLALVSGSPAFAQSDAADEPQDQATVVGEAPLTGPSGRAIGTATLLRYQQRLFVEIDASGLPPGEHGVHLHAIGTCQAPGFTSAGGHLNPAMKQHGSENPRGSHLGDLPNITVEDDGTVIQTLTVMGSADRVLSRIFDTDGTSVIIHAGQDDYRTDPSGNSGGRIACGVLAPQ